MTPRPTKQSQLDDDVTALLTRIEDMPGGWGAMNGLLHSRGLRNTLRDLRRRKNLTQAEVAETMGIGVAAYRRLESDRWPDLRISTIARWARALDHEVDMAAHAWAPPTDDEATP